MILPAVRWGAEQAPSPQGEGRGKFDWKVCEERDVMAYRSASGIAVGTIDSIPSKSVLHRLLLAAALGTEPVQLRVPVISRDIRATMEGLAALGAKITYNNKLVTITPGPIPKGNVILPCGDSGSTLRFLLPVAGARGATAEFRISEALGRRPMEPLVQALELRGMEIRPGLRCSGQLQGGQFTLPGDVSSQFISGLLFALPLLREDSRITLTTKAESTAYIDMTIETLRSAGIRILREENGFTVPGRQRYMLSGTLAAEGDWSDGAVFLCTGAMAGQVTVRGLSPNSLQGDRAILKHLANMGAEISVSENEVTATAPESGLRSITADLTDTPDLAPVLAVAAAAAKGTSVFTGCKRLRYKECDRLEALRRLICDLGGAAEAGEDSLTVHGAGALQGGAAEVFGDHRIAMAASLCGLISDAPVEISDTGCVEKSHPGFFEDFDSLQGGTMP